MPDLMPGLWADGWFYICAAGLLISAVLFFFLLSQYRAAATAAAHRETDTQPGFNAVQPVYIPAAERPAPTKVASLERNAADETRPVFPSAVAEAIKPAFTQKSAPAAEPPALK